MSLRALLTSQPSLAKIPELTWNEVEQDRLDPRTLGDEIIHALEASLDIPVDDLQRLAAKHARAFAEEKRLWSLLVEEAHAFRRKRAGD